ncbi:MAG: hypothetical protein GWP04_00540 [Gammaproteobacteria bacterium]|nr:hypothetical protein [Gammaproteobacteria bacterium]
MAVAAGAVTCLVGVPRSQPYGWILVFAALIVLPAMSLGRFFGFEGGIVVSTMLGLPMAFGIQFPLFAIATTMHWSPAVWGTAAIGLGLCAYIAQTYVAPVKKPSPPKLVPTVMLIVLLVAGAATVFLSGRDSDDWAYGAYIADSAANMPLMASDPVLGTDVPVFPRQSLNLWLGLLGVGARASSLEVPVLLQDHLPVFLAIIALLSTYVLGKTLGGRPAWGTAAVGVQLAWFLTTPQHSAPGNALLFRITEDKFAAMLILAPLIFAAILKLRHQSLKRVALFGMLAGLGLAAVHPITYLIVMAGLGSWAALGFILRVEERKVLIVAGLSFAAALVVPLIGYFRLQTVGPAPGSPDALELSSVQLRSNMSRLWIRHSKLLSVHPLLVMNPLTLGMSSLSVMLLLFRRNARTTLVASLTLATVLLAFNPLITPFLGHLLGVGMLWRFTWLLPIPYVAPAAADALGVADRKQLAAAPLVAVVLALAVQMPLIPTAYADWSGTRSQFRADVELTPMFLEINRHAQPGDFAIAPNHPIGVRLPSYVPEVSLLAFRGPQGTRWHFPREHVDDGVRREEALEQFYTSTSPMLDQDDLTILEDYNVRFVVLERSDDRFADASSRWSIVAESANWAVFDRDAPRP